MATEQTTSAVQRKLAAASNGPQTGERTALRALRLAFARTAADVCDLPLGVIGATQRRATSEDVAEFIRADWLLLLLDGPVGATGPQTGALLLDPDSVASLIQHLTMGAVSGGRTEVRSFTGTDAAMIAPMVDGVLARAGDLVQVVSDARCLVGYSFGARAEDARILSLALEADRFRIFELALDFSGGVRQGAACLILPEPPEPPKPKTNKPQGPHLGAAVGEAHADITAIIYRLEMTLAELSAMAPGDVLPLLHGGFDKTELLTISGQSITTGQLGQSGGFRAIRLPGNAPIKPEEPGVFETSMGLPAPDPKPAPIAGTVSDSVILEGSVLAEDDVIDVPEPDEDDSDSLFDGLSVDEAVLEISELAGLPIPEKVQSETGERSD